MGKESELRTSACQHSPVTTRRRGESPRGRERKRERGREEYNADLCGIGLVDNENRGEEAEAHKQDQLRKQKEGKGHWKDELASDSESIVGPPFHSRPLSGTPRYSWWGVS